MGVMEQRRSIIANEPHIYTATGNPATFSTDMVGRLAQVKASFRPVQAEGTPSPENRLPITGWTGVKAWRTGENIFGGEALKTALVNSFYNATVVDGTAVDYKWTSGEDQDGIVLFNKFKPNTQYTFIISRAVRVTGATKTNFVFRYTDDTYTSFQSNATAGAKVLFAVSSTAGKTIKAIETLSLSSWEEYIYFNECGVFEGVLTENDFTPYTGQTIPVTFPGIGKNKFDQSKISTGSDFSNSGSYGYYYTNIIQLKPNTQYTASAIVKDSQVTTNIDYVILAVYSGSETNVGSATVGSRHFIAYGDVETRPTQMVFTTGETGKLRIGAHQTSGSSGTFAENVATMAQRYNFQIEEGETATSWIAFKNTVYGGYVDVVNGQLVAEFGLIAKTWGAFGNKTVLGDNTRGLLNISSQPSAGTGLGAMCDVAPRDTSWSGDTVHFYTNEGSCIVFLPNSTSESTDIRIVYPLATPIVYPLTPQQIAALKGDNVIWSDANGTNTIEYWKH